MAPVIALGLGMYVDGAYTGGKRNGPRLRAEARLEGGSQTWLDVAVEHELPWVRPKRHRVNLSLALVVDPGVDDVLRENAAFGQEGVILLQRVERLAKGAGHRLDLRLLLWLQLVDVLVDWLRRKDLVLDAIQAGHEARSEREVWVGSRV